MAAESLERKAREIGISLKVEKNGASGVKDALTAEEIAHAKCIIVASDRQVEMARFDGKPMIHIFGSELLKSFIIFRRTVVASVDHFIKVVLHCCFVSFLSRFRLILIY